MIISFIFFDWQILSIVFTEVGRTIEVALNRGRLRLSWLVDFIFDLMTQPSHRTKSLINKFHIYYHFIINYHLITTFIIIGIYYQYQRQDWCWAYYFKIYGEIFIDHQDLQVIFEEYIFFKLLFLSRQLL